MRSLTMPWVALAAAVFTLVGAASPAAAGGDVAWLGVQEHNLPEPAADALDSALPNALSAMLSPELTVETATARSPRALRALRELDALGAGRTDALSDRRARALGAALGAAATARAWVAAAGDETQVTMLIAAVGGRRMTVRQTVGPALPGAAAALAQWSQGIAREAAGQIAVSVRELVLEAPRDAAGLVAAGDEFLERGEPEIAAMLFDRGSALAPGDGSYCVKAARAYRALGDRERARRRLQAAIAADPEAAEARLELGRLHLAQGDYDAAKAELARALELGVGFEAHTALGAALAGLGDLEGARQQYEQAVEANPEDSAAAARLAEMVKMRAAQARAAEAPPSASTPYGPPDYVQTARLWDREMQSIVNEARRSWDRMSRGVVTAQAMNELLRTLHGRSDALARAAEALAPPPALERGHRHRVLAYSLLNQSDFALLRYLERGDAADYDQGLMARQAAIAEVRRAWDLDTAAGWPTGTAPE
jgi:tetratricopeptide (TPR) repeat protein